MEELEDRALVAEKTLEDVKKELLDVSSESVFISRMKILCEFVLFPQERTVERD